LKKEGTGGDTALAGAWYKTFSTHQRGKSSAEPLSFNPKKKNGRRSPEDPADGAGRPGRGKEPGCRPSFQPWNQTNQPESCGWAGVKKKSRKKKTQEPGSLSKDKKGVAWGGEGV